jgi:hypothetical protein
MICRESFAIGAVYATLSRRPRSPDFSRPAAAAAAPSRRVFALTPAGARSLTLTRGVRERLWAGVRLQPLLE